MAISHLTPRYVKNRMKVFLFEKTNPGLPWLTKDAIFLLDQLLKKEDIGVEFGSGRSTLWFAKKLKHLTSVEDNLTWYEKVRIMLSDAGISNEVDYRCCEEESNFYNQSNSFNDSSIDFCLVDGKSRAKCALLMLPKIKSGGILVVDNINWFLPNDVTHSPSSRRTSIGHASEDWALFEQKITSWRRIWTTNGVTDTCLWIKP